MKRLLNFTHTQLEQDVHDLWVDIPNGQLLLIEVFSGDNSSLWDLIFQGEYIRRKKLLTKRRCKIWEKYPKNFPADSIFLYQRTFNQYFDPNYYMKPKRAR